MSILYPTTTITVLQPGGSGSDDDTDDWGGAPDPETGYSARETGVRAHLSSPSGAASFSQEGSTVTAQFRLLCDPVTLNENDRIRDERTGLEYQVDWCLDRPEPMAHVVAGVSRSEGSA